MMELTELNNEMTFEQAYAALRETVAVMEDPKTGIEDSLGLYERACRLVVYCQRKLGEVKMRVTDINTRIAEMKKNEEAMF